MSHKKTSSVLIKGLLCLLMAFVCVQGAVAHDFEVDGICYNINSDGNTVTVTYYGSSFIESMFYYSGNVNISSTVQYGGKSYNVTAIGNDAFQMCNMVTGISLPSSIVTIGNNAFKGCGITSFVLPISVTYLGNDILNGCKSLESIIVDNQNTVFDSRFNCNAIVETSSNKLIAGCKNSTIPDNVTEIGRYAFIGQDVKYIEIPNSVLTIGENAFSGCQMLDSICIPDATTFIGASAFYYCKAMKKLIIGKSVNHLGDGAFSYCSGLQVVYARMPDPREIDCSNNCFAYSSISNVTLYVPYGSRYIYEARDPWRNFSPILQYADVPGDVNDDGFTTAADITEIYDFLLIGGNFTHYYRMDVNGDRNITAADITAIYDIMLGNY